MSRHSTCFKIHHLNNYFIFLLICICLLLFFACHLWERGPLHDRARTQREVWKWTNYGCPLHVGMLSINLEKKHNLPPLSVSELWMQYIMSILC